MLKKMLQKSGSRLFAQAIALAIVLSSLAGTARADLQPMEAPEMDPGSLGSAVALLVGGLLMFTGARSKKD